MAAYTGGQFPYWITITNDGVHGTVGMQSEQIPVTPGVNYQLQVVASYATTWASGMTISLIFFNQSNSIIQTSPGSQANMTGGTLYQVSTGQVAAPAGAAYAVAEVVQAGLPGSALSVYQAMVNNQASAQLNINYTFTYNFWPWAGLGTGVTLAWNYNPVLAGDSDSLVIDGVFELMGGQQGVQNDIPELLDVNGQGPTFRILAPPSLNSSGFGYEASYDLNAPQPTQDVVATMLLDGERPFGARSSNRTMNFPVIVFGTQAGGMLQVNKALEYLMSVIDQQTFQIKWTSTDSGLPMIFDCFRALPSVPLYGFNYNAGGSATGQTIGRPNYPIGMITLQIQALPYGRSDIDGVQNLAFGNPLVNGLPTQTTQNIDLFTTVFNPPPVINAPTWLLLGTSNPTATTSWNITVGTTTTVGNTIVVQVESAANTVTGVTDTQGNVYTLAGKNQDAGTALWQYIFTAPVQTQLTITTDHITITSNTSGNFCSSFYSITGAWAPRAGTMPLNVDNTATSFTSNLTGLNQYDMLFSVTAGLGSAGVVPTNFTSIGTPSGNGFNTTLSWFAMPINATTLTYTVASGLPNPSSIMLFALQPVNQFWVQDTTGAPAGATNPDSAHYLPPTPMHMPWPAAIYGQTLPSPVSIVGLPVLSVWLGQAYDTQWPKDPKWVNNVTLRYTLTDSFGKTISFSKAMKNVSWGTSPSTPKWTRVNAAIPQSRGFSYNSVISYTVRITNWAASGHTGYVRQHAWLNSLVANSQTIQNGISPRGNVYNLFALPGTARSPISVQCQQPASLPKQQELTTPVATTGYWVVPPGVYSVGGESYAAGGAGASVNLSNSVCGAGGAGGEWAQEPNLPVVPGTKVPYLIGSGGLPGQINSTIVQFTSTGLNHWTCPANITSVLVETWGAGAAGAAGSGGGGGGGYSNKTQTVVPGVTYFIWVGVGGKADTGKTAAQNASRNGEGSWFGPNGNKFSSGSFVAANGGLSPTTGSTHGGNGGATAAPAIGTVKFAGGRGGTSPGPSGGGGGGAAGSAGAGGPGQDSQPHLVTGSTPWQTGGLGGLGASVGGGNGGIGAGTPGFPAVGVTPGGGGGGGYTSNTLATTIQVANNLPGTKSVNYLGANGANGMVQLTYAVNGGNPLNGQNTTFGSVALTGKQVVANGGTSAANNGVTGPTGGTGSSNTNHNNGGNGGLINTGALGSYMVSPTVTQVFTNLANGSFNLNTGTSSTATASVAQGVAIVLVESTGPVTDLTVIDSAGNQYQPWGGQQGGGAAGTGVTAYAWVANIEFPIVSGTTTVNISSSTSQEYGYLWMASPWLCAGVTTGNTGVGNGNGSSATGRFSTADDQSLEIELAVVVQDGSTTVSSLPAANQKVWFNAAATNTQAAGTLNMSAYVMENQGGGSGAANVGSGDLFTATLSGAANWAVLCVPLMLMNQQNNMVKMDWRTGVTPGAQTAWATEAAISANGFIMVVGMAGSGSTVTAGPSAMADASGNHYTFQSTTVMPANGGAMFIATAPVTAGLAAGTTGTYNWGHASAAPEYWTATYWIPNAIGVEGVSAVTGSGTAVSVAGTPTNPNNLIVGVVGNILVAAQTYTAPAAQWNEQDVNTNAYLKSEMWAEGAIGRAAATLATTLGTTAPWAAALASFEMTLAGSGGGSGAGPGNVGYPGVWNQGAPGMPGGGAGKGGSGATTVNTNGGGAALPGGGGGGSYSNNPGVNQGGPGGQGMVRLTWTPPLTTMNNLIVHSLGAGSDPNVCPIVPIPITDVPNNTEYAVPSVTGLLPATFGSTYTVIPVAYSWNSATAGTARQVTVTINQYEYPGGPRYSVQATRAVTPATDIVNGFVNLGEVTLPIKDYVKYNDQSYFTVSINDTDSGDRFMDVLFLDTTGQTCLINIDPGQAGYNQYVNYFIDEATADRDLGFIGASFQDRQHTVSVMDSAMVSGGALYIQSGDNLMLVYSTAGAPSLQVTYAPRWYLSRSV